MAKLEAGGKKTETQRYHQDNRGLYCEEWIDIPDNNLIKMLILSRRNDSQLAGHPGRSKNLALVKQCFTWPSITRFVNQYVDGCDSCQRKKLSTQKPYGTLTPLPVHAGPWTDIIYDLINNLPESNGNNSILTVIDWLKNIAQFLACRKTITAESLV